MLNQQEKHHYKKFVTCYNNDLPILNEANKAYKVTAYLRVVYYANTI